MPRPVPPAYLALREEVARFAEGFAAAGRVAEIVQVSGMSSEESESLFGFAWACSGEGG